MRNSDGISHERNSEILGILVLGITTLLFLALVSHQVLETDAEGVYSNLLGLPGIALARFLGMAFGSGGHVIYTVTFIWGFMLLTHKSLDRLLSRFAGMFILIVAVSGMLHLNMRSDFEYAHAGGALGAFVGDFFGGHFGIIAANVVGVAMAMIGIMLATDFLFVHLLKYLQRMFVYFIRGNLALYRAVFGLFLHRRTRRKQRVSLPDDDAEALDLEVNSHHFGFASMLGPLRKRIRRVPGRQDDLDEYDPDATPFDTAALDTAALDTVSETPAPAARNPESIRVRTTNSVPTRQEELPFEAEQQDLPLESSEDDIEQTKQKHYDSEDYIDEEVYLNTDNLDSQSGDFEENYEEDEEGNRLTPEVAAASANYFESSALQPQRKVRARRKNLELDEVPPDFQYPKKYTRPSIDMLDEAEARIIPNLEDQLRATSILLEETLQTFGIEARVTDVTRGPTITRFELEPAPGIKVSRFLALADDIALALKAHRVRVEAPIPGKGRVGIEAPNHERDQVLIRELLENRRFSHGKGVLKLALGKDISGEVNIADLTTMPHLLVAGATGAGKTVCVKSLLASLLFTHTPDDMQLMLIDPKMVELSIFNDIPHLITPVVTDPKRASTALQWLINEMEERYRLFADLRVRNIDVYNQSVENGEIEMEPAEGQTEMESFSVIRKLPYIVCVIDELADLMMLARAEVEDAIARLAQLARAVGIHLIIATQRPSVDVLTGVIKANFPARISFQVSSRVDSRCILDEIGAERLIGMGDMLFLPAGQSKPTRIQGAFVSDDEMNQLVAYLKRQAPPQYRDEIANFGKSKDTLAELAEESDPLFEEAVQVVLDTGQASISMVQRRLRVGYTRAARLIDMMELRGIVGPHTGSKAREILVNSSAKGEVA